MRQSEGQKRGRGQEVYRLFFQIPNDNYKERNVQKIAFLPEIKSFFNSDFY